MVVLIFMIKDRSRLRVHRRSMLHGGHEALLNTMWWVRGRLLYMIDTMGLSDGIILFSQSSMMKTKSLLHGLHLVVSKPTHIALLELIEESGEVCLSRKGRNSISVISDPVRSIVEDHGVLVHSDIRLVRELVIFADVADNIVQENSTFNPKIDSVKEIVEVLPGAWVSNEAGDLR